MNKRMYDLQDMQDVQMVRLKNIVGLDTGKYIGISFMYKFRYDTDLGIGKTSCRRIPCAYLTCFKILKSRWDTYLNDKDQPRYGVNERFIYWKNFKGYSDWRVVDFWFQQIWVIQRETRFIK